MSPALFSAGNPQGGAGETHCPTLRFNTQLRVSSILFVWAPDGIATAKACESHLQAIYKPGGRALLGGLLGVIFVFPWFFLGVYFVFSSCCPVPPSTTPLRLSRAYDWCRHRRANRYSNGIAFSDERLGVAASRQSAAARGSRGGRRFAERLLRGKGSWGPVDFCGFRCEKGLQSRQAMTCDGAFRPQPK